MPEFRQTSEELEAKLGELKPGDWIFIHGHVWHSDKIKDILGKYQEQYENLSDKIASGRRLVVEKVIEFGHVKYHGLDLIEMDFGVPQTDQASYSIDQMLKCGAELYKGKAEILKAISQYVPDHIPTVKKILESKVK